MSGRVLSISKDHDSAISLGNVFQCSNTLIVKKCFLVCRWNFLSQFVPILPLALSLGTAEKSLAASSLHSPKQGFMHSQMILPEPSLLQAEQLQLSQPPLVCSLTTLLPSPDLLQQVHVVSLGAEVPRAGHSAVDMAWRALSRGERSLPHSLLATPFLTLPGIPLGFFAVGSTVLGHVQLVDDLGSQSLLCRTALQLVGPQLALAQEVIPT